MFVINKDIFLNTLIRDVSKWYDKWYKGNLIAMKNLHINILVSHYDSNRFKNCNNLYYERINFLNEVQELVNTDLSFGEASLWMD